MEEIYLLIDALLVRIKTINDKHVVKLKKLEIDLRSMRKEVQELETIVSRHESNILGLCIGCEIKPALYASTECGHLCYCKDCTKNVTRDICPICRGPLKPLLRIYLQHR